MFRPVGSQPSSVYWRRRLVFFASLIVLLVLIALTVRVLISDDPGSSNAAGNPTGTSSSSQRSVATSRTSGSRSTRASTSTSSSARSSSTSTAPTKSTSTSAAPKPCVSGELGLTTGTDKQSYVMTAKPALSLLVTNKGTAACVQNLGDTQIVMRVYNGESRVWGSHDCKTDPTPNVRTLDAGATVRLNIVWTGFSSMPNNCTNRQRVSAGTYTLYASLAGKEATASQFTITP